MHRFARSRWPARARPVFASVALCVLASGVTLPPVALGGEAPVRVAVIVGPVGEELTPVYIGLAEAAAVAAEARGAIVARAYSPAATPENVLAAVNGANIVIYLGHGVGTPNPYSSDSDPATTNGWGLQGPNARGDHSDSSADGTLAYHGEAWIAANARPAPGFVMIYSNACYAAGAGEPHLAEEVTLETAATRVASYSRAPLAELGASAYFATDFYEGAAHLVATLLDEPDRPYASVFASEPMFDPAAVTAAAHPGVGGAEVWLHRSAYFDARLNYWYAFAGNPNATFAGSVVPGSGGVAPLAVDPLVPVSGIVTGVASHYPENAGWEETATVALPAQIGGALPSGGPPTVVVCADRCVELRVVDSCPCYVGTFDQRVANLSIAAWHAVTDRPLTDGLVPVTVHLEPGTAPQAHPPLGDPAS